MPQLDPTWFASQLFWLAVCFVFLYLVLAKLVLPPLLAITGLRESTIAKDLEQAQSMKCQAERERTDYERLLADSRERAQQTVNNALSRQKVKAEADSRALDKQIEQKLSDASHRISSKTAELKQALLPTAGELASLIVEKLVQFTPQETHIKQALAAATKGRN